MKTRLLIFLLCILQATLFSQNLSSQFAGYSFNNGSLNNTFDPGNGNLTKTGANSTLLVGKDGVVNNAISLNGDDLSGAPFNNQPSVPDFSWSFWFNTTTNNVTRTIWRNFDGFSNEVNVNMLSTGKIQTQVQIGGLSATNYTAEIDTPNFILDGNWHHVVVVLQKYLVSGNQGRLRVRTYIDGAEEPGLYMDGINYGAIWQAGHQISVYNYNDGLDEVNFYKDDLTVQDVADLYSQDVCVPTNVLASSKTDLSLNLEWTADASVTEWDIAIVEYGQPFNGTPTTSGLSMTSFIASNLQPDTQYNIFVRGVCNSIPSRWRRAIISTNKSAIRVDVNATGNNDGTSWADAYSDLSVALQNNPNNDFWLKSGTYIAGTSGRNNVFALTANQKVYGGFDGTEVTLQDRSQNTAPTILSGDINGNDDNSILSHTNATRSENAFRILVVNGDNVVLDNLTISGGNADGSTNSGSAVWVNAANQNLLINKCIIENNSCAAGGVVRALDTSNGTNLTVNNSVFRKNFARFATVYYLRPSNSRTLNFNGYNNTYYDNKVLDTSSNLGINMLAWFRNDTGNAANINATFINSTFSDNSLEGTNNSFDSPLLSITRQNIQPNIKVYNCIFWNNTNNLGLTTVSLGRHSGTSYMHPMDIKNSLDQDGFSKYLSSAQQTLTSNPLFNDSANEDYTLMMTSPAVDFGDNSLLGTNVLEDANGNPRIFNSTVDLGAFEFNSSLSNGDFDMQKEDLKLYPNPTSNILIIDSNNQQIETIEIYDMLGKQILKTNQSDINVSNLKSGIYLLKAKTTLGEVVKRFIKQ